MLYERLGSDVTLPCGTAAWDTAVTWRVNGTDLEAAHLNGSQLVLEGLDLSHSGQYACYQGSSWHLHYQALLHVGSEYMSPDQDPSEQDHVTETELVMWLVGGDFDL